MSDCPKSPCVGENVVWYPHGNTNQEPFAATVTARLSDECITLYTLSPTGRREPMLNVKHVNHPDHINAPQGLKRWGAWDLIGEHEERKKKKLEIKEAEHRKAINEAGKTDNLAVDAYSDPDEDELRIINCERTQGYSISRTGGSR